MYTIRMLGFKHSLSAFFFVYNHKIPELYYIIRWLVGGKSSIRLRLVLAGDPTDKCFFPPTDLLTTEVETNPEML
jgi:hypothetical protein